MHNEQVKEKSFSRSLAVLKTLTIMQLKEKMDVSYLSSMKKTLFRVIFFILQFAAISAICYLLFWAVKLIKVFDSFTGSVPVPVLTTVMVVMLGLSTIFTTIGLVKSLYLSKDNLVLLTLPATPSLVFLSKLLVYYVYELRKNFLFLVPFFCAFGLFLGYNAGYYFWTIVLFLFIAALPVLLAALLSMPSLFIYQLVKKVKAIQYVLIGLVLAGLVAFVVYVIGLLPEEINFIKTGLPRKAIGNFTQSISDACPPVAWLTKLLVGEPYAPTQNEHGIHTVYPLLLTKNTLPILAGLIGGVIVLLALCFLLSSPLFYSMASKPFEFKKKMRIEERENNKTPVLLSAIKKEWLVALRDNSFVVLITQLIVIMPLTIALLNSIYSAMSKDTFGVQMTVAFNFVIVALLSLSANVSLASAYSRDGFSSYLNKVQPSTYGALLFSKLTVNIPVGFVGITLTTIVYSFFAKAGSVNLILFALAEYALFIAHLFWSGELDIMNPQYEQYATFSEQSNNPNENKSSLLVFLLSFAVAVIVLLLSTESMKWVWVKVAIGTVVFAVFRVWVYFLKIKVYYKEK